MHFQFSKINAYHMEFSISWCRKIIKIAILSSHYILRLGPVFIRCALMQKIAKIAANSPGLPTFYWLVPELVFCCYNCLDLPWEKFFQVWVTFFPSSWEQEYCVEKRLSKFEAVGREFVTFSRHYSCLRELGKQVTNTWKKLWAWYKSRQL